MESLKILYEDNHLLVINKPSGLLSQPDSTSDPTVIDLAKVYLKEKYHKSGNIYIHPVHRLDRPASGLLLLSKTSKATSRLNELFKKDQITKYYFVLSMGSPKRETNRLVHFLLKDNRKNQVIARNQRFPGAKKAVLDYEWIGFKDGISVIRIDLKTGRPHQIRVQMKTIGCPVIGDMKYGYRKPTEDKSICLHAYKMVFIHPVKKIPVQIFAPVPEKGYWSKVKELVSFA